MTELRKTGTMIQLLLFLFIVTIFLSCSQSGKDFVIISGSENKTLEPMISKWSRYKGYNVKFRYMGSVDIMLQLQKGHGDFDAVWPASSMWISMGDRERIVKHDRSIMNSPVVFGIRKSKAEELGLVKRDVHVRDILKVINEKKLKFMMTSATQSNSGAAAYLGFIYAFLGNPDMISKKDLEDPELRSSIKQLFSGINRSSGSSGWLKDLFMKGGYDAMVNYESVIIETNIELEKRGEEPLYLVYPVDGTVLADSPLGFTGGSDKDKEDFFLKLQNYLMEEKTQKKILNFGRRVAFHKISESTEQGVFNPAWGIDPERIITPVKLPRGEVILGALSLYQEYLRKPSLTVFCLDFSGSMYGDGITQLRNAMNFLLDKTESSRYMINTSVGDRTVIIPFSSTIRGVWEVRGNREKDLAGLSMKISKVNPAGATDIYSPVIKGIEIITSSDFDNYIPAIILMTDGESNSGKTYGELSDYWNKLGKDIPVFSVMFGKAKESQLNEISELTKGKTFDGRKDLFEAFRAAKGYN